MAQDKMTEDSPQMRQQRGTSCAFNREHPGHGFLFPSFLFSKQGGFPANGSGSGLYNLDSERATRSRSSDGGVRLGEVGCVFFLSCHPSTVSWEGRERGRNSAKLYHWFCHWHIAFCWGMFPASAHPLSTFGCLVGGLSPLDPGMQAVFRLLLAVVCIPSFSNTARRFRYLRSL
ncbi:hypothetical protein B0T19DRAFT_77268 [Cercophora scortea]|uniref:Uncharacterized protein n=1 Tax=Cercophora scortea TaxID=314031 RepID=A0AAE0J5Y9_9PEZI|nr:hypothetical protein B0T19DRAFT_77268 [Cercophora scortea]